jgi:hypothetical protein
LTQFPTIFFDIWKHWFHFIPVLFNWFVLSMKSRWKKRFFFDLFCKLSEKQVAITIISLITPPSDGREKLLNIHATNRPVIFFQIFFWQIKNSIKNVTEKRFWNIIWDFYSPFDNDSKFASIIIIPFIFVHFLLCWLSF